MQFESIDGGYWGGTGKRRQRFGSGTIESSTRAQARTHRSRLGIRPWLQPDQYAKAWAIVYYLRMKGRGIRCDALMPSDPHPARLIRPGHEPGSVTKVVAADEDASFGANS